MSTQCTQPEPEKYTAWNRSNLGFWYTYETVSLKNVYPFSVRRIPNSKDFRKHEHTFFDPGKIN